jgi:hypothetical protein
MALPVEVVLSYDGHSGWQVWTLPREVDLDRLVDRYDARDERGVTP